MQVFFKTISRNIRIKIQKFKIFQKISNNFQENFLKNLSKFKKNLNGILENF